MISTRYGTLHTSIALAAGLAAVLTLGRPASAAAVDPGGREVSAASQGQSAGAQTAPAPGAQAAAAPVQPCADFEPDKTNTPPADSPPLLRCLQLVFHPVNESTVDQTTYQYYIKTPYSIRSRAQWAPYDEESLLRDFDTLWKTPFIDDMWIEVVDEPYENGVMGKHVVFHIEERDRIKQVDYVSANDQKLKVEVSKIEETLRDRNITVRLDSFVDDATIRRVTGVIRELHADKGYQDVKIDPTLTPLAGGPKLVHLVFNIDAGPKYQIREVVFDGNEAVSDGKLRSKLKENRPKSWLSFITDAGTYYPSKWADDAASIEEYYQNEGYARALVGEPQVETIEDTDNGQKRWVRLRVPVDEGPQYTIGEFTVEGSEQINQDYLRAQFKVKAGDAYSRKKITKGIEKATEAFGTFGFFQMTPAPELDFKDVDEDTNTPIPGQPPVVDIHMKFEPGKQFFVHRISFHGNTTTHDSVIRRELRVAEGGVFNTIGLRESIRRLNQLGYFQPLEDAENIKVTPTPGSDNQVDIGLTFTEQNRNQVTFGAGVSQFDGFFGQLGYQTSNFLGRGETLGVNLQRGSQARNYQLSFSEPYLFERPITVGTDLYRRQFIFPLQYTQDSAGTNFVIGYPLANYTRMFMGYSYERVTVKDINPVYLDEDVLNSSPFLRDSLLLNTNGRRTVSKVSPSIVHNTVDHPIFPTSGKRLTLGVDVAGLGGNTSFVQTRAEGIFYLPFTNRLALGLRGEAQYIRPYGDTETLPIFERLFLGGEYSVRGFDIRTIGPRDQTGRAVLGGNKTLLFNAEFYINIAGPVRLLAFYDAGQVRDLGEKFGWWEDVTRTVPAPLPIFYDPNAVGSIRDPNVPAPQSTVEVLGRRNAFKTSTGLELRFFMPVLNVPFRLIAAYNPQRGGVLNNSLIPQPKFTFRFAVGTTF